LFAAGVLPLVTPRPMRRHLRVPNPGSV
jgi:hypothetical protein